MVPGNGSKRFEMVGGNDPLPLLSLIFAVEVDAMLTSSPLLAHGWNETP
jgi:hypothetical protein